LSNYGRSEKLGELLYEPPELELQDLEREYGRDLLLKNKDFMNDIEGLLKAHKHAASSDERR
jgi:hypothetical protein